VDSGDSSHNVGFLIQGTVLTLLPLLCIYVIKSGMNNYATMAFLLITLFEHIYIKKPITKYVNICIPYIS
jgi:hypothetical protein